MNKSMHEMKAPGMGLRNSALGGWLRRHRRTKRWAIFFRRLVGPAFRVYTIPRYVWFFQTWRRFRHAGGQASPSHWYPCLDDRTATTAIDSHYFHQPIWALRRIVESGTRLHVDVGSQVNFVGMLTAVVDVTFIDIRPLEVQLTRYRGVKGSILQMPYEDASVSSLSSLHVIEHIGLGRYGDPIDPEGLVKAARELSRILAPGGRLYVTTPIGRTRVEFNSQRVTSIEDVLTVFGTLGLLEFSYIDAKGHFFENVLVQDVSIGDQPEVDVGLGLFLFTKNTVAKHEPISSPAARAVAGGHSGQGPRPTE